MEVYFIMADSKCVSVICRSVPTVVHRVITVLSNQSGMSFEKKYCINKCIERSSFPGLVTHPCGANLRFPENEAKLEEHLGIPGDGPLPVYSPWMYGNSLIIQCPSSS